MTSLLAGLSLIGGVSSQQQRVARPDHAHHLVSSTGFVPHPSSSSSSSSSAATQTPGTEPFLVACKSPLRYSSFPPGGVPPQQQQQQQQQSAPPMEYESPWLNCYPSVAGRGTSHVHHVVRSGRPLPCNATTQQQPPPPQPPHRGSQQFVATASLPADLDTAAFHLKVHPQSLHLIGHQPPLGSGTFASFSSQSPATSTMQEANLNSSTSAPVRQQDASGDREDSPMMGVCVQQSPVASH